METEMPFILTSIIVCIFVLITSFISYGSKHIQYTIDNFLKQIIAYILFSLCIIAPFLLDIIVENPSDFVSSIVSAISIILCNVVALVCRKRNQQGTSVQYKHFVHAFILSLSIIFLIEQLWCEFLTQLLNFMLLYVSFNFDVNIEEAKNNFSKYYKEDLGLISQKCIFLIALFYVGSPLLEIMEQHKLAILFPWLVALAICIVCILILILGTKRQKVSLRGMLISISLDTNTDTCEYKRTGRFLADVNGQKRLITLKLSASQFRVVCDAFRDDKEIFISGTLKVQLGRYSIHHISNIDSSKFIH